MLGQISPCYMFHIKVVMVLRMYCEQRYQVIKDIKFAPSSQLHLCLVYEGWV